MEILQTNEIQFDVFKVLHFIETDNVLDEIFRSDKITLSYPMLNSLAKQNSLNPEIFDRLKEMFDRIIIKNESQYSRYIKIGEISVKDKKVKPEKKVPKHYGKKRILQDINEGNTKTELDRAMLALNDLRNVYSRLKNRGIKDKLLGTKKLSDTDCRDIVATVRIVENRLSKILKNK